MILGRKQAKIKLIFLCSHKKMKKMKNGVIVVTSILVQKRTCIIVLGEELATSGRYLKALS